VLLVRREGQEIGCRPKKRSREGRTASALCFETEVGIKLKRAENLREKSKNNRSERDINGWAPT